jgi:hypothetical protein
MIAVILLVLIVPAFVQPDRGLWHRGDRRDADRQLPAGGGAVQAVAWKPWAGHCRCCSCSSRSMRAYLSANLTKIPDGGWVPLADGLHHLHPADHLVARAQADASRTWRRHHPDPEVFAKSAHSSAARVPGTAVFMASTAMACHRRCCTTSSTTRCCTSAW